MEEREELISRAGQLVDEGRRFWLAGDVTRAHELWVEAEGLCKGVEGAEKPLAGAVGNLGHVARRRGDLEGALALLRRSRELAEICGEKRVICASWTNEGIVLHQLQCKHWPDEAKLREYDGALDCFERAQDLAAEIGDERQLIAALKYEADVLDCLPARGASTSTLWRLHHVYLDSAQRDEAARVLSRIAMQVRDLTAHANALELCETSASRAACLVNLACSYVELGNYQEAGFRLGDAEAICEREGLEAEHVQVLAQRGRLSAAMGDAEEALELAGEALGVAEVLGDYELIKLARQAEAEIEDALARQDCE